MIKKTQRGINMPNKNIKCEISYDGTNFHGLQIQPNKRTVQGELTKIVSYLTNEEVSIIASGRTDAGVHARKQVCNFHTDSNIPINKWKIALNSLLPDDIVVLEIDEMPDNFHSRYDVLQKTYRYHIQNEAHINIFRNRYSWIYRHPLDLDKMKIASQLFLGEHDFTAFSSSKSTVENKVRKIYESDLWVENNEIVYQVSGNGFLYNMVRIIVGTLIEVGRNNIDIKEIEKMFLEKERTKAGITAPAKGLTLWEIKY